MLLITGVAGFIGFHAAKTLLAAGWDVAGIDEVNAYYDPAVKRARLAALAGEKRFRFIEADMAAEGALEAAAPAASLTHILHLAAQAGVRYSLRAPFAYEHANVRGHLAVLEHARAAPRLEHLVYASSSSVYGDRADGPFRESDRCDTPASLYAATKRAGELMSETYARLYGLKCTGLRFFTAYGPWGRPDMALWLFTDAILKGETITVFDGGRLSRDFTYIDDIAAVFAPILTTPPNGAPPHAIYNIGNAHPHDVNALIVAVEKATGRTAARIDAPRNPVEVAVTFADSSRASAAFGFAPRMPLEEGVARFVDWRKSRTDF